MAGEADVCGRPGRPNSPRLESVEASCRWRFLGRPREGPEKPCPRRILGEAPYMQKYVSRT